MKGLRVTKTRPASAAEWDALWRDCDYATYFHSREWGEIWHTYTDGNITPQPLMLFFSDNRKALLPISEMKSVP